MTKINNGGDAFPKGGYGGGMSLRDYFAAKAMQAFIATGNIKINYVVSAYIVADEMIKARSGE